MTTYLSNRDGGKTNEEGHYRFHTKVWEGNVISGLQAVQRSPLALGVNVSTGDAKVDYSAGYSYTVWTDAAEAVSINTADPSNPRIDRIVGYVDRSVTPSSAATNNPGILKFKSVPGTPAGSPTRPNDAAVQSSVGASNPWFQIADVLVGTGVTTISTGNITDNRVFVKAKSATVNTAAIDDSAVTTAKMNNASVTSDKLSLGTSTQTIATSQTTTSTTYADLATVGPASTVTVGANGIVLLSWSARLINSGANYTAVAFAASGANTIAATDSNDIAVGSGTDSTFGKTILITGLTPGSTTFTLKYRVTGGTGTFIDRRVSAVAL